MLYARRDAGADLTAPGERDRGKGWGWERGLGSMTASRDLALGRAASANVLLRLALVGRDERDTRKLVGHGGRPAATKVEGRLEERGRARVKARAHSLVLRGARHKSVRLAPAARRAKCGRNFEPTFAARSPTRRATRRIRASTKDAAQKCASLASRLPRVKLRLLNAQARAVFLMHMA